MRLKKILLYLIFLALVQPAFTFSASVPLCLGESSTHSLESSYNRIILFSWDGVQYNHSMDLYDAGNLPNIKQLVNESNLLLRTYITDHNTTTNPGHVCILTGSGGPSVCPDGNITIWEKIETWNSTWVTGCIAGKAKFTGEIFPSYVYGDVDFWYARDVYSNVCADLAIEFIQNYSDSSFFLFVHFRDPDSAGHGYGENSQQYTNAIIACDTQLGRVMSALETEGILNSTAVVVTLDHGFREGGTDHGGSPWPSGDVNTYGCFIACNRGTVEITSLIWDQNDVAPTVYSLAGISDYSNRFPFLKGYALWDRTTTIPEFPLPLSFYLIAAVILVASFKMRKKLYL